MVTVIFFFAAADDERTFSNYMGVTATPQGFLLPVLGILLVTQEWGQRTAMVTFTLEPHRGKVMGAKVLAALAFGMLAVLLALVLAALGATGTHRHRWLAGTEQCIAVSEHGRLEIVVH